MERTAQRCPSVAGWWRLVGRSGCESEAAEKNRSEIDHGALFTEWVGVIQTRTLEAIHMSQRNSLVSIVFVLFGTAFATACGSEEVVPPAPPAVAEPPFPEANPTQPVAGHDLCGDGGELRRDARAFERPLSL